MNAITKRINITLAESKRLFGLFVGLKYEEGEKELVKTILLEIKLFDKQLIELREKEQSAEVDFLIVAQIASVIEKGFEKYQKLAEIKKN